MFKPSFNIGDEVKNGDIISEFKCSNMGGMRRSKATNTLVIVADHTKGFYNDNWKNGVLHYTGMGKYGNQDINFKQNRTVNESETNNIEMHLFEVFEPTIYIYRGVVKLSHEPYQVKQLDDDGNNRTVWIFPLGYTQ